MLLALGKSVGCWRFVVPLLLALVWCHPVRGQTLFGNRSVSKDILRRNTSEPPHRLDDVIKKVNRTIPGRPYGGSEMSLKSKQGKSCNFTNGEKGVCKQLPACQPLFAGIKSKKIPYSDLVHCSFVGNIEVICCPLDDKNPVNTIDENVPVNPTSIERPIAPSIISVGNITIPKEAEYIDLDDLLNQNRPRQPTPSKVVEWVTTPRPTRPSSHLIDAINGVLNPRSSPKPPVNDVRENEVNTQDESNSPFNPGDPFGYYEFRSSTARPTTTTTTVANPWNVFDFRRSTTTKRPSWQPFQFETPTTTTTRKPLILNPINWNPSWGWGPNAGGVVTTTTARSSPTWAWWTTPSTTTTSTTTTTRRTTTTTTTTTARPTRPSSSSTLKPPASSPLTPVDVLDDWMLDAYEFARTSTPRTNPSSVSSSSSTPASTTLPSADIESTTPTKIPPRIGETTGVGRKAIQACQAYQKLGTLPLTFHILNGIAAEIGEFPHMAAIGYESIGLESISWDCGGTLIADQYVLTAAHCVSSTVNQPKLIRMGKVSLTSDNDEAQPIDVGISSIVFHPEYRSSQFYNDIALIRLNQTVKFNRDLYPACLYTDVADVAPSIELFATGWGTIDVETKEKSPVLLKVNLTSVPLQSCNESHVQYGLDRHIRLGIVEGQLCAFDPHLKGDACQGDSGGPLQIVADNKVSTVVGIISFGINCASSIPGVYARVAHYIDWIEGVVWP